MSKHLFIPVGISLLIFGMALGLAGFGVRSWSAVSAATSWGFDTSNLDKTCKPCDDFYQFAMGGWMKSNPIPPEYPNWGTFTQLADKNQQNVRQVLDDAAAAKAAPGTNEQKIGDFYSACMDTTAIDAAGIKPIEPELARIALLKSSADLQAEVARLQREGVGALFRFGSNQDAKDSTQVIGGANQGGLGLPERDYYLRDDEKSKQLRDAYVKHVGKMFELLGDPADKSAA
jgi:putative endopeptidase